MRGLLLGAVFSLLAFPLFASPVYLATGIVYEQDPKFPGVAQVGDRFAITYWWEEFAVSGGDHAFPIPPWATTWTRLYYNLVFQSGCVLTPRNSVFTEMGLHIDNPVRWDNRGFWQVSDELPSAYNPVVSVDAVILGHGVGRTLEVLMIESYGGVYGRVDRLSVLPVPEVSTAGLLLLGTGGWVMLRRKLGIAFVSIGEMTKKPKT